MGFVPFYLLLEDIQNYPPTQRKMRLCLVIMLKKKNRELIYPSFYCYVEKMGTKKEEKIILVAFWFLLPKLERILVGPSGKFSYTFPSFFYFLFSIMNQIIEIKIFKLSLLFFYQWCTKHTRRRKNKDSNQKS